MVIKICNIINTRGYINYKWWKLEYNTKQKVVCIRTHEYTKINVLNKVLLKIIMHWVLVSNNRSLETATMVPMTKCAAPSSGRLSRQSHPLLWLVNLWPRCYWSTNDMHELRWPLAITFWLYTSTSKWLA